MAAGVDEEVAKYRKMLRNGGTMPSVEAPAPTPEVLKPRKKNPHAAGRFGDMNAFIDVTMATLTRAEVTTWFAMFRYVDSKTQTVAVSVRTIADRSGTSFQHVHKAIASLLDKGLLERLKTGGINSGASVYKLKPTVHPQVNKHGTPVGEQHCSPFGPLTVHP